MAVKYLTMSAVSLSVSGDSSSSSSLPLAPEVDREDPVFELAIAYVCPSPYKERPPRLGKDQKCAVCKRAIPLLWSLERCLCMVKKEVSVV